MKKAEVRKHAKEIVCRMLGGRCCPETDDVRDITDVEGDQEKIIDECYKILDRLKKSLR